MMLLFSVHDNAGEMCAKEKQNVLKGTDFQPSYVKKRYSRNKFQRSRWLRGQDNDYADIDWKFWRHLTDFKWTLKQRKYLVLLRQLQYFKLENGGLTKAKLVNPRSCWLREHVKFELYNQRLCENKKFTKLFYPVHMGPNRMFSAIK